MNKLQKKLNCLENKRFIKLTTQPRSKLLFLIKRHENVTIKSWTKFTKRTDINIIKKITKVTLILYSGFKVI